MAANAESAAVEFPESAVPGAGKSTNGKVGWPAGARGEAGGEGEGEVGVVVGVEAGAADPYDVVIVGAGPAGLSAGLNLVRARRRVLMIDSNRPRHSATLKSHGFLTRDGISPLDLRKLGRAEFESYPEATFRQGLVTSLERIEVPTDAPPAALDEQTPVPGSRTAAADPASKPPLASPSRGLSPEPLSRTATAPEALFEVRSTGIRGSGDLVATARTVLIATGLVETLPALPSIRAYYGTSLHSCTECEGYEKSDAPLALIGETDDLAERALLLSQWSNDLIVFTNGVAELSADDEAALDSRGIGVERRPIADIEGDREGMTGISLTDGDVVLRSGGFVRPVYSAALDYERMLGLDFGDAHHDHLIVTDALGRTSVTGVFAAGDSTPPGAEQLIVAAGEGAKIASVINRHLTGIL